jgi:MFS family permease
VFEIAIFSLGLGAVVGGRWQDRVGPRTVTIVGVVLWGIGTLLAGLGTTQFGAPWLYITYGVIGGFGNGMAYITPVAVVTKWFPDKRGLASGMVVMGFGLGAFFYGFILKAIGEFAKASTDAGKIALAKAAAKTAGTPFDPSSVPAFGAADTAAIMHVWVGTGIVVLLLGGICAYFLSNPPANYSVAGATAAKASHEGSFTPSQVLRAPQFYGLWLILFLNVTAGILIVSNAVPIIHELVPAEPSANILGAYAFVAIFNGLGRFFWGAVSDRLGRNMAYTLIFGIQVIVFFLLPQFHSLPLVLGSFAIILACYGGGFGTMPSFNADYFGTKYLGINYGFILTAWGTAGVVGPLIAATVKDRTGSFSGALIPVAIMLLVAAAIPFFVKKPTLPESSGSAAGGVARAV